MPYNIYVWVIGIGRFGNYLSVLADKEIAFIGDYRYWPICKNADRSPTTLAQKSIPPNTYYQETKNSQQAN